jgi:hypothetical protein
MVWPIETPFRYLLSEAPYSNLQLYKADCDDRHLLAALVGVINIPAEVIIVFAGDGILVGSYA